MNHTLEDTHIAKLKTFWWVWENLCSSLIWLDGNCRLLLQEGLTVLCLLPPTLREAAGEQANCHWPYYPMISVHSCSGIWHPSNNPHPRCSSSRYLNEWGYRDNDNNNSDEWSGFRTGNTKFRITLLNHCWQQAALISSRETINLHFLSLLVTMSLIWQQWA